MNNLKEIRQEIEDLEIQKDLGSERIEVSIEERSKLANSERELITFLNPEVTAENNYLFIFSSGEIPESFSLKNPFTDSDHPLYGKVAILTSSIPKGAEILSFAQIILEKLRELDLKRITLIGFDEGANIVQALSILSPRLFRRAVMVNPLSRVSPSVGVRLIDWIEKYLPVGLPFRAMNKEFDSRPFLHRIRCPIMIVLSPLESFYNSRESSYIANKIPNCYLVKTDQVPLDGGKFSEEFLTAIEKFQQSPAKRPQKNK